MSKSKKADIMFVDRQDVAQFASLTAKKIVELTVSKIEAVKLKR